MVQVEFCFYVDDAHAGILASELAALQNSFNFEQLIETNACNDHAFSSEAQETPDSALGRL